MLENILLIFIIIWLSLAIAGLAVFLYEIRNAKKLKDNEQTETSNPVFAE